MYLLRRFLLLGSIAQIHQTGLEEVLVIVLLIFSPIFSRGNPEMLHKYPVEAGKFSVAGSKGYFQYSQVGFTKKIFRIGHAGTDNVGFRAEPGA